MLQQQERKEIGQDGNGNRKFESAFFKKSSNNHFDVHTSTSISSTDNSSTDMLSKDN
jgi:hypothetical protein